MVIGRIISRVCVILVTVLCLLNAKSIIKQYFTVLSDPEITQLARNQPPLPRSFSKSPFVFTSRPLITVNTATGSMYLQVPSAIRAVRLHLSTPAWFLVILMPASPSPPLDLLIVALDVRCLSVTLRLHQHQGTLWAGLPHFLDQKSIRVQQIIQQQWVMENLPSVKCPNGHDVGKLCIKPSCPHPSPICRQAGCEVSRIHEDCMMVIDAGKVIQKMVEKGLKYSAVDEEVIKCFDQMAKLVEMERQEYVEMIKDPGTRLRGEEGRLYRLLKEGLPREIMSAMVNRVTERLADKSNADVEKQRSEVVEMGKRVVQAVEKGLQELRWLWKPVDFRFSSEMCHKQYIQVLSDGKEVKNTNGWGAFALVSPTVPVPGRIRVRVGRDGGRVCLGLAHKQQVVESGYQWPQNHQGVNGWVINVLDPGEHQKPSSFRFSPGEEVEMEYCSSSGTLRYQNKTKNLSHTLRNIREQQGNPLHFCVGMWNKDEQVEIV